VPATIAVENLHVTYGRADAVRGLCLEVAPGRCHALFGRNGAGKTTTMKALLGLVPIARGQVRLFGLDPLVHEREVKSRVAFVPDAPAFYPWMTVRDALDYAASFRTTWSLEVEGFLLGKFSLDPAAPTHGLSKGQRTQLALTVAVASDPEVLILDEPTSGLDPLVRRQFLEAVISAFHDRQPDRKTLLISTHLISEFEGVVDDFTLVDGGRDVLTLNADEARMKYCRLRAWFEHRVPAALPITTLRPPKHQGRMVELVIDRELEEARSWLTSVGAERVETTALSLEEIFLVAARR
jgi:ABC-2 type transport system ATP-binding protein